MQRVKRLTASRLGEIGPCMVQSMHGLFSCDLGVMTDRDSKPPDGNSVAEEVRSFYEDYPYPPPVDNLDNIARGKTRKSVARSTTCSGPREPSEDQSILIAGCGTSQAAKHAMRWPAARVTGIDFSETSVRCTEELKRKYKLDNLQVRHLPIERARELETSFDQIVCTGVLHHLPDPDAGLALCVTCSSGWRDERHVVRALRTGWHLHVAGLLQTHRHRRFRRRDSRSACCAQGVASRPSATNPAARRRRIFATMQRSPTRCCIHAIVPIRCRSCSTFLQAAA